MSDKYDTWVAAEAPFVGRRGVLELEADFWSLAVKPLWLLRMKTRSPPWELGVEAIVAG